MVVSGVWPGFYTLGVVLLYAQPFLAWCAQPYLQRYQKHLVLPSMAASLGGAILMATLVPEAGDVFMMYLAVFWLFFIACRMLGLGNVNGFLFGVYGCFAISVLWEWPIQLTVPQNPDAVIASSFKALGVPLFLYQAYKLGWKWRRPGGLFTLLLLVTVALGILDALAIETWGINSGMAWISHLYRVPWFLLLLNIIDRASNSVIYKKGPSSSAELRNGDLHV